MKLLSTFKVFPYSMALIVFMSNCFASELIVFESKSPKYIPGNSIAADNKINLESGQSLTLIASNGKIIKLIGPYDDSAIKHTQNVEKGITKALKVLMSSDKTNSKDMGITRDTSDVIRKSNKYGWVPEPWVVNINRSGHNCVKENQVVRLWRSSTSPVHLKLSMGDEFAAHKELKEDEVYISLPAEMPIVDGGKYLFTIGTKQVETIWHIIPKSVSSVPVTAAWMEEVGCRAQATATLTEYAK